MLLGLLLTLNILICLALVGVVLLQRSEGGVLGTGGPTGLITTRGAGDLLTRTTWVLFTLFLTISLALTLLGGRERSSQAILNRLRNQSVNPDALALPAAGRTAAPATAQPPPIQLPSPAIATPSQAARPSTAPAPKVLAAPIPSVRTPSAARTAPTAPAAAPPTAPAASSAPAPVVAPPPKIEVSPPPLAVPPPPAPKDAASTPATKSGAP
jgi:preprotein translocase subunit SecG